MGQVRCLGGARDESIVDDVSKALLHSGYTPLLTSAKWRRHRQESTAPSDTIARVRADADARVADMPFEDEESDEEYVGLPDWVPSGPLKTAMQESRKAGAPAFEGVAVRAAIQKAADERNLQPFREHPRIDQRRRAGSTRRDALRGWLQSEEGQAWQVAKKARHEQAEQEEQ